METRRNSKCSTNRKQSKQTAKAAGISAAFVALPFKLALLCVRLAEM